MGNTSSDNEKGDPDPPAAPQQLSRGFWRQAGRQRRQEAGVFGYNHEYAEKLKEEDIRTQFGSQYHQRDSTFDPLNVEQMKNWKSRVYDDKTEKFWSDDDYRQYWEYAAYEYKIRMASIGHGLPGDLNNAHWRWAERRKKRKREEQDERDREEQRHQQDQSSRRTRPGLTQANTDCPWYTTVEEVYKQLAEKECIEPELWRSALVAVHTDHHANQPLPKHCSDAEADLLETLQALKPSRCDR